MPTKDTPEVRNFDLSDCQGRVSPYYKVGYRIGDLQIVDNIERKRRDEPYRIQVRCMSCNGDPYWCRRDHLRSGRCKRCTKCQRENWVERTHGPRPHEPESAKDIEGGTHSLKGISDESHELNWLYQRCVRAKSRCRNNKNRNYGGRGIKFKFKTPTQMAEHLIGLPDFLNAKEKELTVDRIDNYGNYETGNLRWATSKTQNNNQRTTRYVRVNDDLWVKRSEAVDIIHKITGCSKTILNADFQHSDIRDFGFVLVRARFRGDQENWETFGMPDVRALKIYRDPSDMYSIDGVIARTVLFRVNTKRWHRADFTT